MRISIILLFLFLSSYAIAETSIDSKAEFKIPIGQEQKNDMTNTIKATAGKEFVITLNANVTTGYGWQLANPIDDSLVKLVRAEYLPNKTDLVGSDGKSIWTFQAVRAGKTQISFKYIRPWEKNTPPAKEATYMVIIEETK